MNDKISKVDYSIEWLADLMKRDYLDSVTRTNIVKGIEQLRKKQADEFLNLSIIGEFSAGKSAFINNLLQQELLVSNNLSGTTAACTIIEYDDNYSIYVKYKKYASSTRKIFKELKELQKFLQEITTAADSEGFNSDQRKLNRLQNVDSVTIKLPADFLKAGIRIIDTPGINAAGLKWHEEVTVKTLEGISDLALVLIPSERPGSEELIHFIRENLMEMLPQCAFVVTKMDNIRRQKERDAVCNYLKQKLIEEFNLEEPVVLPYVSYRFLEGRVKEECKALSKDTEEKLKQHLVEQRSAAQFRKIKELFAVLSNYLDGILTDMSKEYTAKLNMLKKSQTIDLKQFVETEKIKRAQGLEKLLKEENQRLYAEMSIVGEQISQHIKDEILEKSTIESLKEFLANNLQQYHEAYSYTILKKIQEFVANRVKYLFDVELKNFQQDFVKNYTALQLLPVEYSEETYELELPYIDIDVQAVNEIIDEIDYQDFLHNDNLWAAGGTILGGLLLGPLGGAAGGYMGKKFAPKLDMQQVKKDCLQKVKESTQKYYSTCNNHVMFELANYMEVFRANLWQEIDRYHLKYMTEVKSRIELEQEKQAELHNLILKITKDKDSVENLKQIMIIDY